MPSGILFIPHRRRRLLRRSPYLFVYSGYIVLLCSTSSNVDVKQTGMGNLCGWICSCLRRSVSTPPPPHPFTSILHVFVLYSSFTTSNAGAGASGMGWVCNCQSTKETRFSTLYTQSLWTVERTDFVLESIITTPRRTFIPWNNNTSAEATPPTNQSLLCGGWRDSRRRRNTWETKRWTLAEWLKARQGKAKGGTVIDSHQGKAKLNSAHKWVSSSSLHRTRFFSAREYYYILYIFYSRVTCTRQQWTWPPHGRA